MRNPILTLSLAVVAIVLAIFAFVRSGPLHVGSALAGGGAPAVAYIRTQMVSGACHVTSKTDPVIAMPGQNVHFVVVNRCAGASRVELAYAEGTPFTDNNDGIAVPQGEGKPLRRVVRAQGELNGKSLFPFVVRLNGADEADPEIVIEY